MLIMISDLDIDLYGIQGALEKKRCGRLGVYIEALDKCVYPSGGSTSKKSSDFPDGPAIPKAEPTPAPKTTPQSAAKAVAAEVQNRKKVA